MIRVIPWRTENKISTYDNVVKLIKILFDFLDGRLIICPVEGTYNP
jgi:hypothetical protein